MYARTTLTGAILVRVGLKLMAIPAKYYNRMGDKSNE